MFLYFSLPFFLPIIVVYLGVAYLGWERIAKPRLEQHELAKGSIVGVIPILGTSLLIYVPVIYPLLQKAKEPTCNDCGLVALPFLAWLLGSVLGLVLYTTLTAMTTLKTSYPSSYHEMRSTYLYPPLLFAGFVACGSQVNIMLETVLIGLILYLALHIYIMYKSSQEITLP